MRHSVITVSLTPSPNIRKDSARSCLKLLLSLGVINNNFETVSVSQILGTVVCPDQTRPAPYLLVVDDDHVIGESLGAILRDAGYAVTVSCDAESAIEIAELAPPELVLTDVGLPGMNGVDLALRLQQLIPGCKIILLTGMPEEAARLLSIRAEHRFRIFAKPTQPAELLKCISELLAAPAYEREIRGGGNT